MNAKLHKAVRQLKRNTLSANRRLKASERIVRYNARLAARTQPKAQPERKHKPKKGSGPTWPHSIDQIKQSRPLIVLHPVRSLKRLGVVNAADCEQMALVRSGPKHELDAMVCMSKPVKRASMFASDGTHDSASSIIGSVAGNA